MEGTVEGEDGDLMQIIYIDLEEETMAIIIDHGGVDLHFPCGIISGRGRIIYLVIVKMGAQWTGVRFLEMVPMIVYGLRIAIVVVMYN